MTQSHPVAAVFGSRRPQPSDALYTASVRVGYLLAQEGYTVMTGGYGGVMEAASKGAKQAGGHTIGVTVAAFEKPANEEGRSGPNPYVDETVQFEDLGRRLLYLCSSAQVAVAMKGGVGTLAEVAVVWNLLQSRAIMPMPFILYGSKWGEVLQLAYADGSYINAADMELFHTVNTPEEIAPILKETAT